LGTYSGHKCLTKQITTYRLAPGARAGWSTTERQDSFALVVDIARERCVASEKSLIILNVHLVLDAELIIALSIGAIVIFVESVVNATKGQGQKQK